MKKITFAVQLIALMALLPVYMIAELNYERGGLPVTIASKRVTGKKNTVTTHPASIDETVHFPLFIVQ